METYDYIVVAAGSAGCVPADRLIGAAVVFLRLAMALGLRAADLILADRAS